MIDQSGKKSLKLTLLPIFKRNIHLLLFTLSRCLFVIVDKQPIQDIIGRAGKLILILQLSDFFIPGLLTRRAKQPEAYILLHWVDVKNCTGLLNQPIQPLVQNLE